MPIRVNQNPAIPLSCEMDSLVLKIQQQLRLKSKGKHHSFRHARSTPYSFPGAGCSISKQLRGATTDYSAVSKSQCRRMIAKENRISEIELEPHELLQKLLKEQTLIQEAVRRLQKRASSCDIDEGQSDIESEIDDNSNVHLDSKPR